MSLQPPELSELLTAMESEGHETADERWLVSYADMMTLLFGAFVMLYAMYDRMPEVERSALGKFSPPVKSVESDAQRPTSGPLQFGRSELERLNEELVSKLARAQTRVHDLESRMKDLETRASESEAQPNSHSLLEKIRTVEKERDELAAQLRTLSHEIPPATAPQSRREAPVAATGEDLVSNDGPGSEGLGENGRGLRLRVTSTLPDGRSFETTTDKVSYFGFQLNATPAVEIGRQFTITLWNDDGSKAEALVVLNPNAQGNPSRRVSITGFPTPQDGSTMRDWLRRARGQTNRQSQ